MTDENALSAAFIALIMGAVREAVEPAVREAVEAALPAVVRRAALPAWLTRKQLSELTGMSLRRIDYLRSKGRITYVRRGRTVLFRTKDVEAFLDEGLVEARASRFVS